MAIRTDYGVCMLCEAVCGISVDHDGERVLAVRGDPEDPFSRGHICPKGVALADVQNDPDRLRRPLRRCGDRFEEISWEEALEETAQRLHQVQERFGRDAVALYTGNPTGHSYSALLYLGALATCLGTRNRFSATSVDALPRVLTSRLLYGNQALVPVPDLDRSHFLLILGANPAVSNGSAMTAPDVVARLRGLRERGGRIVVVDPRRSETAALADRHLFIRPGGDAALLAAMIHTLFAEGLARPGRLASLLEGWEAIPSALAAFSPERVGPAIGIEAGEIAQLARDFAAAPSAVAYGRFGANVQEFGLLAAWLIDVLNVATGNLDRAGGSMFTTPAVDLASLARWIGQPGDFDRWRSRVGGLPEFNGELPVAAFAEEIETPGAGQVRALVTHAGNPVLSLPNGRRLERAFRGLDFMVSIDVYLNETTRLADIVLPSTFGLEHEHYPVVFLGVAVRNVAHYARALLPKPEGGLHDWEIALELVQRIEARRGGLAGLRGRATRAVGRAIGPRGILRLLLRLGPYPITLAELERRPHGVDLGPLQPRLPSLLGKDGRIRIAPEPMLRDLPRAARKLERGPQAAPNGLVLIGRRTLRSNNSWMHNSERLVSGRERCVLFMHPSDAEHRGLATGQRVVVKSRVGEIEAPLQVTDEVMAGVVSLPHGWGHGRAGTRLAVAGRRPGVSVNDITDDSWIDEACGTSSLNGVPVSVTAVAV
jgi:anaerobic selenocysteine-containing dehydrogenase